MGGERCYGSSVSISVCIRVSVGDNYPAILDKGKYFIHHFTLFGLVCCFFFHLLLYHDSLVILRCGALCFPKKEWTNCMSVFFPLSQSHFLFRSLKASNKRWKKNTIRLTSFFSGKFAWLNISFFMVLMHFINSYVCVVFLACVIFQTKIDAFNLFFLLHLRKLYVWLKISIRIIIRIWLSCTLNSNT